jgi:PKD repeat protein
LSFSTGFSNWFGDTIHKAHLKNCFDDNGNITTLIGTGTDAVNCTSNIVLTTQFISLIQSNSNFLRINVTSILYAAGLTTTINTSSIEGYSRPNMFSVTSIGASEPNVVIDFTADPLDPAIYDSVSFTSIINEATIPSYLWDLDDGKVSTQQHPVDSYPTPGLKDITLIVQDSGGRFATVTKPGYVDVHNYGLGFTAEPVSGQVPLKVRFTPDFARVP